jgi:hypothetical protein
MPQLEGTRDPQLAADRANLKALAQLVDNMVPRLEAIQADMAVLEASSPPTTVNLATIQAMAKATRDEAKAIGDLAQGAERTLKALDTIIRHLFGPPG